MANAATITPISQGVDTHLRLSVAINALDAVRDLCGQAVEADASMLLGNVSAENFQCLIGLIVGELRAAHEDA